MRFSSSVRVVFTIGALSLALTACAEKFTDVNPGPNAGLLVGNQLKAMLAPDSFFDPGFVIDKDGSQDTQDSFVMPTTVNVTKPNCSLLSGTSWLTIAGAGRVSFATSDYVNKSASAEIAQEIDEYRGNTASDVLAAISNISGSCATYLDAQTNTTVHVVERATPGLGDQAYTVTLTSPAWKAGATLMAVKVGTAVVAVTAKGGPDNGQPTALKVAKWIVGQLKNSA